MDDLPTWARRKSTASDPVGMTVYALDESPAPLAQSTWLSRWPMFLVLLLCAAPVVASYWFYYFAPPKGRVNYGTLIDPQRDLPDRARLPLTDLQGQAVDPQQLKKQWLFVMVAAGRCDAHCEHSLYMQHQIYQTLGKDRDRVEMVWFIDDAAPTPEKLRPSLRDWRVLRAPHEALAQWLQAASGHVLQDHWYVVDPLGHWMMRFPAEADPVRVKKDWERLLRASAGWDQAGR